MRCFLALLLFGAGCATGAASSAPSVDAAAPAPSTEPVLTPLEVVTVDIPASADPALKWLEGQDRAMRDMLREIVEMNSGTLNREGLNTLRGHLEEKLVALGFETSTVAGGGMDVLTCGGGRIDFADHLVARRAGSKGLRVLLSGHMDTVFGKNHAFQTYAEEGDVAKGPGVADMKGGIVVLLFALEALEKQGALMDTHLTVILNTDEEMGSLGSREHIEALSREHDVGLVFEGTKDNGFVRARKGLGQARLRISGRASHAGAAHAQGISAVRELAHKIVAIESITDYDTGTTVNVGLISGGEARNTVPPCADAYIDLRYTSTESAKLAVTRMEEVASKPYTQNDFLKESPSSNFWHALHRPAKPASPASDALLAEVLGVIRALGGDASTRYSGGGTDGSIMQSVGLPTVDSLGIDGAGAHSPREQANLNSLVPRAKATAVLLLRLLAKERPAAAASVPKADR